MPIPPSVMTSRTTDNIPVALRWVIRQKHEYGHGPERVLQYARYWKGDMGGGIEWVDVPSVDLTGEAT